MTILPVLPVNGQVRGVTVDVKTVMDTWTRQTGFPVVQVSVVGRHLKLRQERFLFRGRADRTPSTSDHKYKWRTIPSSQIMLLINDADLNLYDDYNDDDDDDNCVANANALH